MNLRQLLKRKQRVRTPTVLQMEMVECGAAAVGIVLGYFGRYVPLEELRIRCGVSRDGSKASNMVKAARSYGLEAKGYRMEPKKVRDLTFPVIVHWNFNHFLVVEGFHNDTWYLNDPATGPRTVSDEQFNEAFTGVVLTFAKGEEFKQGGLRSKLVPALTKRLRGTGNALAYVVLAGLALVIPGLLLPVFARVFVDNVLVQNLGGQLRPLLIGIVITAIVRSALTWLQQRALLRLETRLSIAMSSRLVWHMLSLPMEFFAQRSAGDISQRINLNDRVANLLSGRLATTLLNTMLVVFYVVLMVLYSPMLTLVAVVIAACNGIALRLVARKRVDANQRMLLDQGMLYGTSFNGLQNIEMIKATGGEDDFFARWSGYQAKFVNATQELGVATSVLAVVPGSLSALSTALILTLGGYSVMQGDMTIGMLVAFQSLMAMFLQPITQLVNMSTEVQEVEGILNRLDDVTNYPVDPQAEPVPEMPDSARPGADNVAKTRRLGGHVSLKNVTFGYNRLGKPLIKDFSMEVKPGMRVALVGRTGSGKSTIARLIAGLYTPWEGEILFDDRARPDIPRPVLNRSLAVVDQEIFLFEGSVRDNLTMWNDTVPDEAMVRAAKDAVIHDTITSRPEAYESSIEEDGRNFSGGQRQRLEIARALVTEPSILVLDEATAALDPLTEKAIDDNLRRRGCTCIIVAHRLSTIRDCDEIIVLRRGKPVQRGTHDELWKQKRGLYARLIRDETPKSDLLIDSLWDSLES